MESLEQSRYRKLIMNPSCGEMRRFYAHLVSASTFASRNTTRVIGRDFILFLGCCVLAVPLLLALPFLWCGCEKENQSSLVKADAAKITLDFSYLSKQCSLSPAHADCHENCWLLSGSEKQIVLPRCQKRKVNCTCFPSECCGAVINDRWLIQTDFSPGSVANLLVIICAL